MNASQNIQVQLEKIIGELAEKYEKTEDKLYFGDVYADLERAFNPAFANAGKVEIKTYNTLTPELFRVFANKSGIEAELQFFIADDVVLNVNRLDSSFVFFTVYTPFAAEPSTKENGARSSSSALKEQCLVSTNIESPASAGRYDFIATEHELALRFFKLSARAFRKFRLFAYGILPQKQRHAPFRLVARPRAPFPFRPGFRIFCRAATD